METLLGDDVFGYGGEVEQCVGGAVRVGGVTGSGSGTGCLGEGEGSDEVLRDLV